MNQTTFQCVLGNRIRELRLQREMTLEEIQARFNRAKEGLKLLLMAWARYEDELPDGRRKNDARDARWAWGRIAEDFLSEE